LNIVYYAHYSYFVLAGGPLASVNQTCASNCVNISSSVRFTR